MPVSTAALLLLLLSSDLMVYNQRIHVCVPTHVYTDIHRNILRTLHANLGQMLRMGGGSRFTSWLV